MVDRRIDVELDATLVFNQKTTIALLQISADAFKKLDFEPCERKGGQAFYHWPDVVKAIDEKTTKQLLFNQKMTAALIDISVQAFSKWPITPAMRIGREAFYYWPDVFAEYVKRRFPMIGGEDGEDYLDLNQERARLAKEQADKLEMENAIQRGEIAYLPDIARQQGRVFEMIRTKALGLPTKCAPHANPENPNIARDVIEREVLELLGEVAAADLSEELGECGADVRVAAVDSATTAKVNGHGVVRHKEAAKPRK